MDPITTAALISGGSSILSGLLPGKKEGPSLYDQLVFQERQLGQQSDNALAYELRRYEAVREGAERGGFNPLTALRASGGGSPAPTSANAPLTQQTSYRLNDAIREAGAAAADAIIQLDPIEQERRELELELMRDELRTNEHIRQRQNSPVTSDPNSGFGLRQNASPRLFDPQGNWRPEWGVRPEDAFVLEGEYMGRLITLNDGVWMMFPEDYTVHELREGLQGTTAEVETFLRNWGSFLPRVEPQPDGSVTILTEGPHTREGLRQLRRDLSNGNSATRRPTKIELNNPGNALPAAELHRRNIGGSPLEAR